MHYVLPVTFQAYSWVNFFVQNFRSKIRFKNFFNYFEKVLVISKVVSAFKTCTQNMPVLDHFDQNREFFRYSLKMYVNDLEMIEKNEPRPKVGP